MPVRTKSKFGKQVEVKYGKNKYQVNKGDRILSVDTSKRNHVVIRVLGADENVVDIRQFYEDEDGIFRPTKKGTSVSGMILKEALDEEEFEEIISDEEEDEDDDEDDDD